jgi:cation transporter-like permease
MSFTRDGAVIGEPRIVFAQSSGGRADDAAIARSMATAIRDCTPLHFSAQLGSAIAGQVLDIRFISRSRATIVAPP